MLITPCHAIVYTCVIHNHQPAIWIDAWSPTHKNGKFWGGSYCSTNLLMALIYGKKKLAKAVKYKLNISFKTCEQPYGYGSALKTNGRPSNDLFDVSPCLVWKCINIVLKPLEPWGYGVPKKMTRCRCKKKARAKARIICLDSASSRTTWAHEVGWLGGVYPYGYGSIPINTIFRGMNIHLPAILMFTRGARFWPIPIFMEI